MRNWLVCGALVLAAVNSVAQQTAVAAPIPASSAMQPPIDVRLIPPPTDPKAEEREWRDLDAQEAMVIWARRQAFLAGFALLASLGSIALLLHSLRQTQQALSLSRTSVQNAEIAARHERQNSVLTLRAYAFIDSATIDHNLDADEHGLRRVDCDVKNFGSTPAATCYMNYGISSISANQVYASGPDLLAMLDPSILASDKVTLAQGATTRFHIWLDEKLYLNALYFDENVFLIGNIHYADIFGEQHKSEFCMRLDSETGSFRQTAENCSFT